MRWLTGMLAAALFYAPAQTTTGETFRWINPINGDWSDPANWSPAGAPGVGDRAVLELPAPYTIFGDGQATQLNVLAGDVTLLDALEFGLDAAPPRGLEVFAANSAATLRIDGYAQTTQLSVAPLGGDATVEVLGTLHFTDSAIEPTGHLITLGQRYPDLSQEVPAPRAATLRVTTRAGTTSPKGVVSWPGHDVTLRMESQRNVTPRIEVLRGARLNAGHIRFESGEIVVRGAGSTLSFETCADAELIYPDPPPVGPFTTHIEVTDGAVVQAYNPTRRFGQFHIDYRPSVMRIDDASVVVGFLSLANAREFRITNGGALDLFSISTQADEFMIDGDSSEIIIRRPPYFAFFAHHLEATHASVTNGAQVKSLEHAFMRLIANRLAIGNGATVAHADRLGANAPQNSRRRDFYLAVGGDGDARIFNGASVRAAGRLRLLAEDLAIEGPSTEISARSLGPDSLPDTGETDRINGVVHISGHDVDIASGVTIHAHSVVLQAIRHRPGSPPTIRLGDEVTTTAESVINILAVRATTADPVTTVTMHPGAVLRAPEIVLMPEHAQSLPSDGPTITGDGRLDGAVFNGATIAPGQTIGALRVGGDYVQATADVHEIALTITGRPTTRTMQPGALRIDIATTGEPRSDLLEVRGDATLDGDLAFFSVGPSLVRPGDYVFLTAATVTGEFARVTLPPLHAGFAAELIYEPERVLLRVRARADLTGDHRVNGRDLAALLARWNTSDPDADLNADGVVSGEDLAALLAEWDG